MNDIKLFGKNEVASKEAKGEKIYYDDHEVIRRTKKNRTLIYILGAVLFLSVAGLGFYEYLQDKNVAQNIDTLRTDFSRDISNVSQRVDAVFSRVLNLEKKTGALEVKTNEHTTQIEQTQQDVTALQKDLKEANAQIASLQYTEEDARQLALLYASQFNGLEVGTYDYNSMTDRWEIGTITFNEQAEARRTSAEVVNVIKTQEGYDVALMLGYKGFRFTNGTLYFQMTVHVSFKGAVEGYDITFSHG